WLDQLWAEYLTVIATPLLIPFEIYALVIRPVSIPGRAPTAPTTAVDARVGCASRRPRSGRGPATGRPTTDARHAERRSTEGECRLRGALRGGPIALLPRRPRPPPPASPARCA